MIIISRKNYVWNIRLNLQNLQKYNEPNLKVDQGGITLNELADTGYRKDYADLQGTTDLRLVATLGTSIALKSYEFDCVGRVRFLGLYKT